MTVLRETFIKQNPICENLPMYLAEIFDEKPDAEKQLVKFQAEKTKDAKLKAQKIQEFNAAMNQKLELDIEEEENRL